MGEIWNTKSNKEELIWALNITSELSCPPEEYRVKEHTSCFNCNECNRYALENYLMINKEEVNDK